MLEDDQAFQSWLQQPREDNAEGAGTKSRKRARRAAAEAAGEPAGDESSDDSDSERAASEVNPVLEGFLSGRLKKCT